MTTSDLAHLRTLYDRYDQGDLIYRWALLLFRLWPALDRAIPSLLWQAEQSTRLEGLIDTQAARIRELEAQRAVQRERQRVYKRRHKAKVRAVKRARVEALADEIEAAAE